MGLGSVGNRSGCAASSGRVDALRCVHEPMQLQRMQAVLAQLRACVLHMCARPSQIQTPEACADTKELHEAHDHSADVAPATG
jgi:hypothetical protein